MTRKSQPVPVRIEPKMQRKKRLAENLGPDPVDEQEHEHDPASPRTPPRFKRADLLQVPVEERLNGMRARLQFLRKSLDGVAYAVIEWMPPEDNEKHHNAVEGLVRIGQTIVVIEDALRELTDGVAHPLQRPTGPHPRSVQGASVEDMREVVRRIRANLDAAERTTLTSTEEPS